VKTKRTSVFCFSFLRRSHVNVRILKVLLVLVALGAFICGATYRGGSEADNNRQSYRRSSSQLTTRAISESKLNHINTPCRTEETLLCLETLYARNVILSKIHCTIGSTNDRMGMINTMRLAIISTSSSYRDCERACAKSSPHRLTSG